MNKGMVHRTLENLEISWDEKDDLDNLENLEITWDFFHSHTSIFYFHAIPIIASVCSQLPLTKRENKISLLMKWKRILYFII